MIFSTISVFILIMFAHNVFADATIGKQAPQLVIKELNGNVFDLEKQRGKVVILSFWASWCEACRLEIPELNQFYNNVDPNDLVIMALSLDRNSHKFKEIAQQINYNSAMLSDVINNQFETPSAIPSLYIIDKKGILRNVAANINAKELGDIVAPLLY